MHKVAAIQMTSGISVEDNLIIVDKCIQEATQAGAKLVVLPEMFPIFGKTPHDKITISEEMGEGAIQNFLSRKAKENQIWIIGGTIPIKTDTPNKIHAACIVYNDRGEVVARYDKKNLFDAQLNGSEFYNESATVQPGDTIVVVDTPVGKVGLSVCFDIRFSALFSELLKKGAEILALPAAFTIPTGQAHWELLTRARAVESLCYLIGACQGGMHENGLETYGHSLIIDPWGKIIAEADGHTSCVITAEIDLNYLYEQRRKFYNQPLSANDKQGPSPTII